MGGYIQRFTLRRTQADAWMIRDNSDDSVVCIIHKGKRDLKKTQGMVDVMLKALNCAVQPKRQDEAGNSHG